MKTALYIFCSLLLTAGGLITLLVWNSNTTAVSIATSLIAGGLASLAFSVMRYFDDKEAAGESQMFNAALRAVSGELQELSRLMFRMDTHAIARDDPALHCIYSHQLREEVTKAIKAVPRAEAVRVDVLGFSLYRFYREQATTLLDREDVVIRMIVQDPSESIFELLAKQEGRDAKVMRTEVFEVTAGVSSLIHAQEASLQAGAFRLVLPAKVPNRGERILELRWFSGAPSVTLSRLNDLLYVRARFLNEGRDSPVVFERYRRENGLCFEAFEEYFEHAWAASRQPRLQDLDWLQRSLVQNR